MPQGIKVEEVDNGEPDDPVYALTYAASPPARHYYRKKIEHFMYFPDTTFYLLPCHSYMPLVWFGIHYLQYYC